jgi:hypothetical protein
MSGEQLALPFLTLDQVVTIDAARAAVDRAQGNALARRAWAEADELGRIGAQLVAMLDENAASVRRVR